VEIARGCVSLAQAPSVGYASAGNFHIGSGSGEYGGDEGANEQWLIRAGRGWRSLARIIGQPGLLRYSADGYRYGATETRVLKFKPCLAFEFGDDETLDELNPKPPPHRGRDWPSRSIQRSSSRCVPLGCIQLT